MTLEGNFPFKVMKRDLRILTEQLFSLPPQWNAQETIGLLLPGSWYATLRIEIGELLKCTDASGELQQLADAAWRSGQRQAAKSWKRLTWDLLPNCGKCLSIVTVYRSLSLRCYARHKHDLRLLIVTLIASGNFVRFGRFGEIAESDC